MNMTWLGKRVMVTALVGGAEGPEDFHVQLASRAETMFRLAESIHSTPMYPGRKRIEAAERVLEFLMGRLPGASVDDAIELLVVALAVLGRDASELAFFRKLGTNLLRARRDIPRIRVPFSA